MVMQVVASGCYTSDHSRMFRVDRFRQGEGAQGFGKAISCRFTPISMMDSKKTLETMDACHTALMEYDLHCFLMCRTQSLLKRVRNSLWGIFWKKSKAIFQQTTYQIQAQPTECCNLLSKWPDHNRPC